MTTPIPRAVPAHLNDTLQRLGPDHIALEDRGGTVTLAELLANAACVAHALQEAGVKKGDRVGFYADNSRRWILVDLGIQLAGGVSVPRGVDTPAEEMAEFLRHAEAGITFAHSARHAAMLEELRASIPTMGEIICLDPKDAPGRTVDDLVAGGDGGRDFAERHGDVAPDDLATIIYTSGTTGRPKGVMLRQSNFAHQVHSATKCLVFKGDDKFLSVLPPWHIFERAVEFIAICKGARLVYTNRRRIKEDMAHFSPTFMPTVPRIWETVYNGIQKALRGGSPLKRGIFRFFYTFAAVRAQCWDRARGHKLRMFKPKGIGVATDAVVRAGALLVSALCYPLDRLGHAIVFGKIKKITGGHLRGAIVGGGLMPPHIDTFLRNIQLGVLVGYGLTETSPVLTVRREHRNILGSIGTVIPEVELEIRDPETNQPVGTGEIGVVWTRGPQVMQGYYKDPELTASVMDEKGWFDTGDLACMTEEGDLCFRGRIKETIVLAGGENVEPSAIEAELQTSPLIEQAIVVGQDRKTLAALIVPAAEGINEALGLSAKEGDDLSGDQRVFQALKKEALARTSERKNFERIARIAVLPESLSAEAGTLTQTLKPKRHVIVESYKAKIEEAYG